jgi:hypothetical protein
MMIQTIVCHFLSAIIFLLFSFSLPVQEFPCFSCHVRQQ